MVIHYMVSYRNMYKWTENGETLYTPHVPQNTGGIVLSSSSVLNVRVEKKIIRALSEN